MFLVVDIKRYEVISRCETERGAKIACTRFANKTGRLVTVLSSEEWAKTNPPMKKVKNLMSGEEIEIPVNTPLACDPSSETYWSM